MSDVRNCGFRIIESSSNSCSVCLLTGGLREGISGDEQSIVAGGERVLRRLFEGPAAGSIRVALVDEDLAESESISFRVSFAGFAEGQSIISSRGRLGRLEG